MYEVYRIVRFIETESLMGIVSVLQDEKSTEDFLHNYVNVLETTELYA